MSNPAVKEETKLATTFLQHIWVLGLRNTFTTTQWRNTHNYKKEALQHTDTQLTSLIIIFVLTVLVSKGAAWISHTFVGSTNFLELIFVSPLIWVMLQCQLSVGLLDFCRCRIAVNAKDALGPRKLHFEILRKAASGI